MSNLFEGAWRLVSLETRTEEGDVSYPWGRDPVGLYIFGGDGFSSVAVMAARRPNFASGDIRKGTTDELVSASAYVSYAGRYEIKGNKLVVHVEVSFFPNWVGHAQERFFEFSGNRLTLSSPPVLVEGKRQRAYAIWEPIHAKT